ncbi:MAG: hypothetical protein PHQ81_11885 [Methanofollis sp.]|nr:hypothetical protein [Methanofollis sp.]
MKQHSKKKCWAGLLAGLVFLSVGCVAPLFARDQERIVLFLIVAGSALIVTSLTGLILSSQRKTAEEPDERDQKLLRAARSKSWTMTFCLIIVLFLIEFTGILHLGGTEVLMAVFLMMGISATGFTWLYTQRGDTE